MDGIKDGQMTLACGRRLFLRSKQLFAKAIEREKFA